MQTADFVSTLFTGKEDENKMTVAFVMALNALQAGHSAIVLLMVEAVELGQPGAMDAVDIGAPFPAMKDVLSQYRAAGGRVAICGACMQHNGFTAEQMDPAFEIVTAPDVVNLLMGAKGSLPIT